jgi:exodeoxyribonuclease VII large subunit
MLDTKEPTSVNNPHVSVSELAQALKRTLEDRFGYVRVRGEISNYRGPHASGHVYFNLKDEAARIEIVIWRTTFARIRPELLEGLEVIASGKITTFPGKSSYQLIVDSLEPAGLGALMALLDARSRQLAAEGLFNLERKRPLPFLPRVVGVVTSPNGSVIRDILHRLVDRFPVHVVLWPVRVQGEGSAEEIAAAIVGIARPSQRSAFPQPDVLIVARGGGSLEDLWSFNDEHVVRAVADCPIPVISAVGHETDWTLIDHAADVRAPTPTAAAEMCVPVRSELISRVVQLQARRGGAIGRLTRQKQAALLSVSRGMPPIGNLPFHLSQRLDSISDALQSLTRSKAGAQALTLAKMAGRLSRRSPYIRLAIVSERVTTMGIRLATKRNQVFQATRQRLLRTAASLGSWVATNIERRAERMESVEKSWRSRRSAEKRLILQVRLDVAQRASYLTRVTKEGLRERKNGMSGLTHVFYAVNYKAVLARGFALVMDRNRHVVKFSDHARKAGTLTIRFSDGDVTASTAARIAPRRSLRRFTKTEQNELF